MFRVENNVPEVYINESRDFQLIARLYDLVFQTSRQSIDSLENVSSTLNCNNNLLPLLSTKLGFFNDLDLVDKQYRKTLAAFPQIIKYKGSMNGIKLIVSLFERLTNTEVGIVGLGHKEEKINQTPDSIEIQFNTYSPNTSLLQALLEYVRPTGLFIDYAVIGNIPSNEDVYTQQDNVTVKTLSDEGKSRLVFKTEGKDESTNESESYSDFGAIGFIQIGNTGPQKPANSNSNMEA